MGRPCVGTTTSILDKILIENMNKKYFHIDLIPNAVVKAARFKGKNMVTFLAQPELVWRKFMISGDSEPF